MDRLTGFFADLKDSGQLKYVVILVIMAIVGLLMLLNGPVDDTGGVLTGGTNQTAQQDIMEQESMTQKERAEYLDQLHREQQAEQEAYNKIQMEGINITVRDYTPTESINEDESLMDTTQTNPNNLPDDLTYNEYRDILWSVYQDDPAEAERVYNEYKMNDLQERRNRREEAEKSKLRQQTQTDR